MSWDLSPMLKKYGIERSMLGDSDRFVPLVPVIELLEESAEVFQYPLLGLEIARRRPPTAFGILTYLVKASPDVRYALSHGNRYGGLLNPTRTWVAMEQGKYVTIKRVDLSGYTGPMKQYLSLSIAQYFKLVQALCGRDWHAEEVSFTFSVKGQQREYKRYLDTHVRFSADTNSIRFASEHLDRKLPSFDGGLLRIVEGHIERLANAQPKSFRKEVELQIRQMLDSPACNLDNIAHHLGMHSKALQRKLEKEDTTFQKLLLQIRMEYAKNYLEHTGLSVNQVADLLGYSSGPALSRSFKQQCGISPQDWRRQNRSI